MINKPIFIKDIEDFYKYFGRPDSSFILKIRMKKLEKIKKMINEKRKD